MKPNPDAAAARRGSKPRLVLSIATALGAGYVPRVPGTVGSLIGVVLAVVTGDCWRILATLATLVVGIGIGFDVPMVAGRPAYWSLYLPAILTLICVSLIGVWSAGRVARFVDEKDPQLVVIDEVSGQHLALLLGLAPHLSLPVSAEQAGSAAYLLFGDRLLNWKYLLLGFILFRIFDIWKPFPVRQAEKLPGGWGIMADDWVAAIYAALGLWVARYLGL